ncbi:MAG: hypothetical protein MZV49_15820 [Rhodopseudomonas palustris]|nr:hypothetical protein [Rhodopseudomonas palustris]
MPLRRAHEAKALQAAALKALAGEIDARAGKLAAAPDEQFVLTADGTIRWTGDAVAKLVAADDAMQPRLRIIADEPAGRRGARGGAGQAGTLAEDPSGKAARAAVRAVEGRRRQRHRARHRFSADRGARRAGARRRSPPR